MIQKRTPAPGDGLPGYSLNVSQLNEQVYEILKGEILSGSLASGERLSVEDISGRLGVSPTPVRDAIRSLSSEGLVQVSPRRGTFVTEFSRADVREVFECRRLIECAAADRLPHAPEADLRAMRELVDEMSSLVQGDLFSDYPRFIRLDAQLHNTIVGLLQNRRLSDFYEKLRWPVQVVLALSQSSYQRAGPTLAEHHAVVQAFERREAALARRLLDQHLTNAEADLLQRMPADAT
jgi:DNA-binding GntR family transcriptional regulator